MEAPRLSRRQRLFRVFREDAFERCRERARAIKQLQDEGFPENSFSAAWARMGLATARVRLALADVLCGPVDEEK